MAASAQQTMESVERRRLQLEENVAKLAKALEHWSTWEEEYEMLKKELQSAKPSSSSEMVEIGRSLGGSLVNEREVEELLGKDLQTKRTANQVVDMISRRIDYVQQNRSAVEKQLDAAEKQLAGVSLLLDPGLENEEGLPMMDIEEELDEEENVISRSVSQPGKVAPELMEALRKAGLHKAEQKGSTDSKLAKGEGVSSASSPPTPAPGQTSSPGHMSKTKTNPSMVDDPTRAPKAAPEAESKPKHPEAPPPKKSVSFSEDSKPDWSAEKPTQAHDTKIKEDLKSMNFKPGSRVYELDDDENIIGTHIMPKDESLEDAELRREMLQYGLSEVGQVVAELDLDDSDTQYSDEELDEDYEEDYDSDEESEEEDEHGRSAKPVLTEDYRQKMVELEKKLNARMMQNVGPRPDLHPLAEHADDVRRLRVRTDQKFGEPMDTPEDTSIASGPKKKGVRFADGLDISDTAEHIRQPTEATPSTSSSIPTMSDTIVERSASAPLPPTTPSKPAKVSRFKSVRASSAEPPTMLPTPPVPQPPPVPTGPAGRTVAGTVVEHTQQPSEPQAPNEFDPVIINREIQTEYHKMRNKMIQQQGGFLPTDEDNEGPLVEDRDGKTKKVSRFKAARLNTSGL